MKKLLTICVIVLLAAIAAKAQQRIYCDRGERQNASEHHATTRGAVFNSSVSSLFGSYHVPVVLAAFQDIPFTTPDVEKEWDAMLNESGFSKNGAAGCLSDYFKIQSGGKFNLTFDVLGPVTLPDPVKYYGENRGGIKGEDMRPEEMIWKACLATGKDFSPYDWDGDGVVDVVMVIFAGHGENRGGIPDYIWPHKYNIFDNKKVGELSLYSYACVSELGKTSAIDGYGTFCHEFSHCLGLPDLYPMTGNDYSFFDEWDLMDGGNYANHSWSPPHYSAFERQRCGWLKPVELSSSTTISGLPPFDQEAVAYIIRNDNDAEEYYLLENRQQRGWDAYVPGNGLLITHVRHYDGTLAPNNSTRAQVELVYADNRSYRDSEAFFGTDNKYTEDGHNHYLSLASYPYIVGESINNHLTYNSTPAMKFDGKPVTNIRMSDDGTISFDFMQPTDIQNMSISDINAQPAEWYDLKGCRLPVQPSAPGIYIIRYHNGKTKKIIL